MDQEVKDKVKEFLLDYPNLSVGESGYRDHFYVFDESRSDHLIGGKYAQIMSVEESNRTGMNYEVSHNWRLQIKEGHLKSTSGVINRLKKAINSYNKVLAKDAKAEQDRQDRVNAALENLKGFKEEYGEHFHVDDNGKPYIGVGTYRFYFDRETETVHLDSMVNYGDKRTVPLFMFIDFLKEVTVLELLE